MNILRYKIPYPEPIPEHQQIIPVFLPFAGCMRRCIFCAQHTQTNTAPRPLSAILESMSCQLEKLNAENACLENPKTFALGLYGGTFTALDPSWMQAFLSEAMRFADKGLIRHIRCSTRPDSVSLPLLRKLAAAGLHMVELGIQSFDNRALAASGRGYSQETALKACSMVQEAGLELGIQLMPGLPGSDKEIFQADIQTICSLPSPVQTVRLYPCLVLEGTELAQLWSQGHYTPWDIQTTVEELANACLWLWERHIRVIRLGVKEESNLVRAVLAGPRHPAFGDMVRGTALKNWLLQKLKKLAPKNRPLASLGVPRRLQGTFWGHKGMFKNEYALHGIQPDCVHFDDNPEFEFIF